jgi:glycosyltransferase involved in cell wall biosynthesis
MNRISVIVPLFNQAEYFLECVESILDQTQKPYEIIVINDGSTDHSLEYAKTYESKGVKVINQVNKGLSSARNTGIMNATGEYVLPLDADDKLFPTAIERITATIEETGADVVAPSFRSFGVREGDTILSPYIHIKDFIGANRLGYFSAIKRSVLLEVGGYSPRMAEGYEDYHIWFDIFKRGHSLAVIQEPLIYYRTKENSMYTESIKHHDKLMAQIMKDHKEVWSPLV